MNKNEYIAWRATLNVGDTILYYSSKNAKPVEKTIARFVANSHGFLPAIRFTDGVFFGSISKTGPIPTSRIGPLKEK